MKSPDQEGVNLLDEEEDPLVKKGMAEVSAITPCFSSTGFHRKRVEGGESSRCRVRIWKKWLSLR